MKFFTAAAALVAAASAAPQVAFSVTNGTTAVILPDVYVTKTVSELTTYCPTPTVLTQGGKTYTITTATTLTITSCSCTVVETKKPSSIWSSAWVPSSTPVKTWVPATSVPKPSAPGTWIPKSSSVPYPSGNGTAPIVPTGTAPIRTITPTTSSPAKFTGGAARVGAGMFAVVAAGAAFL